MEHETHAEAGLFTLLEVIGHSWSDAQKKIFLENLIHAVESVRQSLTELETLHYRRELKKASEYLSTCIDIIRSTGPDAATIEYHLIVFYQFMQMEPTIRHYTTPSELDCLEGDAEMALRVLSEKEENPNQVSLITTQKPSASVFTGIHECIKKLRRILI
ncbi:hypothetical protein K8942_02600 [Candidatus Peribacteria bacterium]|nr:MAG: hypothetical protein K8942_02600 [Candidatus Peribacteria bacterium]